MIQDSSRETKLIKLFDLIGNTSRIGWDAKDSLGNEYEIKTTTRNHVSTARDLGYSHLDKWSSRMWIVANGSSLPSGDFVFDQIYFLSPMAIAGWISSIRERLDRDMLLVNHALELTNVFFEDDLSKKKIEKILKDGIKLNDPGIPWKYIVQNGVRLVDDYPSKLQKLVADYLATKGK